MLTPLWHCQEAEPLFEIGGDSVQVVSHPPVFSPPAAQNESSTGEYDRHPQPGSSHNEPHTPV
jgi:hypothetical protein